MASLGYLDTEGKVFQLKDIPSGTTRKKKKEEVPEITTVQPTVETVKPTVNVNNDGYEDTGKKYGDYNYQDYINKKDYKIYKKDGKSYYYDEKRKQYVDMDAPTMTSAEQDKKDYEEAVKNGFVDKTYKTNKVNKLAKREFDSNNVNNKFGLQQEETKEQVLPTKISEQIALDTSGLTKEEKKKYAKSLIRQEKQRDKELSYVRTGGAGLTGTFGELQNIGRNVEKDVIDPLSRIPSSYEYGQLSRDLSEEYYKKMMGKKNKVSEIENKINQYNLFNADVVNSQNQLDTYFKNLPNQVGGIVSGVENAGILGGIGAIGGGLIGGLTTKTPTGALVGAEKGAKWLGGAGYVKGQAENTFKLEAGAEYQTLLEMGVPEDIARKEALRVGTENALIESGESILDLITLGKAGAATDALKEGLLKKYGPELLKSWGISYGANIASEGAQESLQEQRSIAGEKRATKKAGIERDDSKDTKRILESGLSGAFSAAISGGATKALGVTENTTKNQLINEAKTRTTEKTQKTPQIAQNQQESINIQETTQAEPVSQETTQIEEVKEQPRRIVGKRDYSSPKFNNLSDDDLKLLDNLYMKDKNKEEYTQEDKNTLDYLKKKAEGIKNPEINTNIKDFKDIQKDYIKYGKNADLENFDTKMTQKAKEIIQGNKQGRRTKQEWLDVAKNIGMQAEKLDSEALKKYAYESFMYEKPNQKQNLNRQGQKYVSFGAQDWVKAVYEGAGAGKKMQQPAQAAKNLQNISNTTKENIPEEKQEKVITAKNNQGQTIKLKQDSKNKNVYNEEAINKDLKDLNTQFKNKTIKSKNGMEVSNFYSNITEKSKFIDPDIRNMFKTEDDIKFYKKVSNEKAMNKASQILGKTAKQQEKAFDDFISKKDQFNAVDGAQGWQLLQRFNDAGDYDRAYLVAKKMREMGTSGGQYIQSLAIQSRLTPEGMYKWAVGELMDAEQKFNSEKGRTKNEIEKYRDSFKLTPEETEFIKTQMEKIQSMEDGRAKDIELAKINTMLQNKLPTKKGQSLKSWMRISMLFNPKTQVRNVAGNLSITPVNTVADFVSGAVDKAISKKTNVRTIGAPSLGGFAAYGKGAIKGLKEATQDYKLGIDTKNVRQDRFDVGQGKPFNENQTGPLKGIRNKIAKGLNATNDLLGYIMDAGDRAFYQGSVENSLYNQQKLNNSKEITNEMREIAENEGLQRTWNDNNEYTKAVLDLRRSINKIGNQMHLNVGEYGLGDLLIPFAKTPANLTKAIVDYSPVGFVNAITEGKNLKNAIETGNYTPQMQHDFSQTIGKAAAGTLLYVLGTSLAKAKITSGNSDEDKDLKNFMRYNLGIQPYSIKIGDKSFTYDWAQPIAAPFAITADIEKGKQENMTPAQALQHFLTTGFNILSEQSFMSGINDVLNNNDGLLQGIEQQIVNMPSTAIPTLLKQITDMTDGTKRQTYSKEGQIANMKKTAMSKIPSESKKLAPQVDVLGNEIQKYGGKNNWFNVFFNPANMEKGKKTPVAEEIYSLYEATQDKTIIPRKVDYSTKINGVNKILTTDEMATWQKASGNLVTKEIERAMKNNSYKNMNNEQKAKVINKIVNYSYQKAKSETFDTPLANVYNGAEKAKNKGIPIADYYISTVLKSSK